MEQKQEPVATPVTGEPRVACVSGFFNPLHVGHLELLERSKALVAPTGGKLYVIVNNDHQAHLKKGSSFMPEGERLRLVRALRCVDAAILSVDTDPTVRRSLEALQPDYFCNGGDRHEGNVPEDEVAERLGITMVYGLGDKVQSSSWLIAGGKKG